SPVLHSKHIEATLIYMTIAAKATISLLAMLLIVQPVMACAQPGMTMTAAERACCKQMAQQCGDTDMAKSHGCCHPQVSRTDLHAFLSTYDFSHIVVAPHSRPIAGNDFAVQRCFSVLSTFSSTDSPPKLLDSTTTILRICSFFL